MSAPLLTPRPRRFRWCYWLAAALVTLSPILNFLYLASPNSIGLSEDECHYWEWARHLDYGYYSKGPGIAAILALALRLGRALGIPTSGQTGMVLLRTPALLFSLLSGWLTLDLAYRIFRDARAALFAILLSAAVPMFAVGALMITIDSPMYLCWAASVYALWRHLEAKAGGASWLYAAALAAGLGCLCKPVLLAVPLCAALAAWADPAIRRRLATWHSAAATALFLALQSPTLIWNARHGWVTFLHIATQGGLRGAPAASPWWAPVKRLGEYVGGQAGGLGGIVFVMLLIAIVLAFAQIRCFAQIRRPPAEISNLQSQISNLKSEIAPATALKFLLAFTLPLWLFYAALSLWKDTEVNWPAASYFAAMVLLGGVAAQGWSAPSRFVRRAWRAWTVAALLSGLALTAFLENTPRLYPWVAPHLAASDRGDKSMWNPRRWDLTASKLLRGADERARLVETVRTQLSSPDAPALVATTRYDTSSSLAYYLPGQPFVFCLMSAVGERQNQYDLWPGLNQRTPNGQLRFAGRNVVLVGALDNRQLQSVIAPAFAQVGPLERLPIMVAGIKIRDVDIRRCYNFQGLPALPTSPPAY